MSSIVRRKGRATATNCCRQWSYHCNGHEVGLILPLNANVSVREGTVSQRPRAWATWRVTGDELANATHSSLIVYVDACRDEQEVAK